SDQTRTSITIENGSAVEMVADCSAERPPAASRTAATAPLITHQKTRWRNGLSVRPPAAIVSMTSEPESAEVTKKMAISSTARVEVAAENGRYSKNWNSATDRSACTAVDSAPPATVVSI